MKKAKKAAKNNLVPGPDVLEGIPAKAPYADFAKTDAYLKQAEEPKESPIGIGANTALVYLSYKMADGLFCYSLCW